jgi:very-short-patch-repair endonuclease
VRTGRGRYALPYVDEGRRASHALHGVLSHTSAALAWGWELKAMPDRPHVTVPVKRKVSAERRANVHLHRADLHPDDVVDGITSKDRTLEQCLRSLPWDEGLAVADSALRNGFWPSRLAVVAKSARGPGSPQVRRIAEAADGRSANPFESVLRSIAIDVADLSVVPQVRVGRARADLVDEELRIVLEADSFAWHGDRAALRRDARRYNIMVVDGWIVLRFAWEDVMLDPEYVRTILLAVVALAQRRSEVHCPHCRAA